MVEEFFEKLARERDTTVEDIRAMISARIRAGINSDDPQIRKQWARIPCAGDVPTPEEWLRYVVEALEKDGREDLLKRYLNI